MTEVTTRPAESVTPATAPMTGTTVADPRTLRHLARAEQQRLSADAQIERRARAARLDLDLHERRRASARRERQVRAAEKDARVQQRGIRRAERRARLRVAALAWTDRALFVLPVLFPMAVAWVGQIRFAMTVMGWPLPAAIVFAAGFELSTAYVARLDWLSRAAGDSGLLFRAATWAFAAGAATMNYWHAADPGFAPTGEAVSYGLMSLTGVVLWELMSTYRHRTALRQGGRLPATRPRFGLARWIWFGPLTRLAWLLAVRDGHTTTDSAWNAAIAAIDRYGTVKAARTAIRTGRPVPRPALVARQPEQPAHTDTPPSGSSDSAPADRDSTDRDETHVHRDSPVREDRVSGGERDSNRDSADRYDGGPFVVPRNHPAPQCPAGHTDEAAPLDGQDGGRPVEPDLGEPALSARMLAYARDRIADGARVTGADLDRRFGTRDYGRKVLRRLAAVNDSPRDATTAETTPAEPPG